MPSPFAGKHEVCVAGPKTAAGRQTKDLMLLSFSVHVSAKCTEPNMRSLGIDTTIWSIPIGAPLCLLSQNILESSANLVGRCKAMGTCHCPKSSRRTKETQASLFQRRVCHSAWAWGWGCRQRGIVGNVVCQPWLQRLGHWSYIEGTDTTGCVGPSFAVTRCATGVE